jgi:hypothetical protein
MNLAKCAATLENIQVSADCLGSDIQFCGSFGGVEATLITRPVDD